MPLRRPSSTQLSTLGRHMPNLQQGLSTSVIPYCGSVLPLSMSWTYAVDQIITAPSTTAIPALDQVHKCSPAPPKHSTDCRKGEHTQTFPDVDLTHRAVSGRAPSVAPHPSCYARARFLHGSLVGTPPHCCLDPLATPRYGRPS